MNRENKGKWSMSHLMDLCHSLKSIKKRVLKGKGLKPPFMEAITFQKKNPWGLIRGRHRSSLKLEYEKKRKANAKEKDPLKNRIHGEEISIICETSINELLNKAIVLTFLLQGLAYILPLDSLFTQRESGKMEMLIKYIEDWKAIWTFWSSFMSQFSMIFNYEEENAEIKKLKKLCSLLEMLKKILKIGI